MKFNKKSLVKILSVFCIVAMVLTTLFADFGIISALTDGSDDSVVSKDDFFDSGAVYKFETDEDPVTDNSTAADSINMTRGGDGKGVAGWTYDIINRGGDYGNVLYTHNEGLTQTWATCGGYRLNNYDGVYRLKTSTTYVVNFEINLTSAPKSSEAMTAINTSTFNIGYGAWDAPGDTNGFNTMSVKLYDIISVKTDAEKYTVNSTEGSTEYDVNSGWHKVTVAFTTPEDFGSADNALSFYSFLWPGTRIEIDNVEITELSKAQGLIIYTDDFHGKNTVFVGKAGDKVELPVITPDNPANVFEGWYTSSERTDDTKVGDDFVLPAGETVLYARFDAPVSVTFKNTIDGSETVVTGNPGEAITYPANPVVSGKWFKGWYTDENYTTKYGETVFGYSNKTVYSYFINPAASGIEDFETYNSHKWENLTVSVNTGEKDENGNAIKKDAVFKSNYLYFGKMMSLCDEKAYGGKYSLRFEWDADMQLDYNDPNTYATAGRHNQHDAITILEDIKVDNNTVYLVSFKYYVEKAGGEFNISAVSGASYNAWGGINVYQASQPGSHLVVPASHNDGEWHDGEFVITTNFNANATSMFVSVNMPKNVDVICYLDDFEFTPIAPDESYIKYDSIVTSDIFVGKIGYKLPDYTPKNGKHTLLGWYNDSNFTEEFDETVYTEAPITAYAKWDVLPITFDGDYNFDRSVTLQFGNLIDIVNEEGVGNGDDYAAKFTYDADKYYSTLSDGTVQYHKDRYNMPDHTLILKENLKADTVYLITYDVRASKANLDYSVSFANASSGNIWGALNQHRSGEFYANRVTYSKSTAGDDWVTTTVALKTPENLYVGGVYANALYVYFTVAHNLDDGAATVYVDNIKIEEASAPMVVFQPMNGEENIILTGKAGETIKFPEEPELFAYEFSGWYTDIGATEKFEATAFAENEIYVLNAGYTEATTKTFDYEDYNVPYADPSKSMYLRHDCEVITSSIAYSGTHVMKADRSFIRNPDFNPGGAGHLIKSGNTVQKLKQGTNYIITFRYYIETQGQEPLRVRAHAGSSVNFWGSSMISNTYYIALDEEVGKWHTGTLVCNGDLIAESWHDHLYISWVLGTEGMYYFDDVTVTELPAGQMAYFIDNGGCKSIPEYVIGTPGQSFASQLPKNPKYDNHEFLGYYVLGDDGKYQLFTDMVFRKEKTPEIVARFIKIKTVQDFETFYAPAINAMPAYSVLDFDYELYDATAEGNSADKVTSGKYSLHRLGNSAYFENALLLTQAQQLVAGEKYTVTMKVKLGKHSHTNGAIKIVSNNSGIFAWAPYGDYYPVVAVADLADGQWHEVSYTFTAIEPFVSVQTPGYCEIFIDDVIFTHQPQTAVTSKPVEFTEYVINEQEEAIDVTEIIDINLGKNSGFITYIIIGGAVVLIIAALVILLIVFKRKKGGQK